MITFFQAQENLFYAVGSSKELSKTDQEKLSWLFSEAKVLSEKERNEFFIGPRKEMITPWSTNAVEITQNMGIEGIERIEEFHKQKDENANFDPMLQAFYHKLDQDIFTIDKQPEPIISIENIAEYNTAEGLALKCR